MTASHVCVCEARHELPSIDDQTAAWDLYVSARKKADATLKLEDGRVAALAFRSFYELFTAEDRAHGGR